MYKVLLVDDGHGVADSIRSFLQRNFSGQTDVVVTSSTGDIAGLWREHRADIVFFAPGAGVSGDGEPASLNAVLASFASGPPVIVLAPAGRMDAVRKAAQAAAGPSFIDVLAIPLDPVTAAAAMRNALSAADISRRRRVSEIRMREKLDSVVNIVESDFIYSLIFTSDKAGDIEPYLDFFGIRDTSYFFMTLEMADLADLNRQSVYAGIRDLVSGDSRCILGPLMRNRVVLFTAVATEQRRSQTEAKIRSSTKAFYGRLCAQLGTRIKIGVSAVETDFARSLGAYEDSLKALLCTDDAEGLFYIEECGDAVSSGGVYPLETERKLLDRAAAGDLQGVHGLFATLYSWLKNHYPDDLSVMRGKVFEILVLVRNQTRALQPQFGGFAVWKDSWKQIAALADADALERHALSELDECLAVVIEHKQSRMSPIIIKACTIIHESLSEDISLEEISRRVEISSFYFSKLFKEETGENFIDYITMARMQKAKRLLREPGRSIKDISALTGYSDPNYFSKLFKKIVGLTPTEFRESV
jgi:two-component system, response regulator YesN